jgi:hypothetical protein
MSTILKALEKARREKVKSAPADVDAPTFLNAPTVPSAPVVIRQPRWGLIILSVVLSVAFSALAVVAVLQYADRLRAQTIASKSATPAATEATASAPTPNAVSRAGSTAPAMPTAAVQTSEKRSAAAASAPLADLPPPVPMTELLASQPPDVSPAGATPFYASPASGASPIATATKSRPDEQGGFVLGPILYDPRSPMAIVNGLSVREGGVYENFRVLKITPDSVTVQRAGETPITLRKRR